MTSNTQTDTPRVGYVLKRYPRFSETFVVNEILAHEAAGTQIDIFALRPPSDTHFQPGIAKVRAPVQYLRSNNVRAGEFWTAAEQWLEADPDRFSMLAGTVDTGGLEVYQSMQLAESVQKRGIQHLHAHFGTSAATVARLTSLLTGVPYTFTAHAKDIFHEYVDAEGLGQKIADAAAVVTVSDYNVAHLRTEYPRFADKLVRIYNGLPISLFHFSPYGEREPLILAVGRLVEKKGLCDLVSACKIIHENGGTFRCDIVGGGEEESTLRRKILSAGLENFVRLTGPLPSDAVADRLRQASVLVAPCVTASTGDRDGLPTILLEAMALGTPIIGTDVTGIPEVVQHERTGLLVPEKEPQLLASCINRLLQDSELAASLAKAARALVEQEFNIERNAAKIRALFAPTQATPQLMAEAV